MWWLRSLGCFLLALSLLTAGTTAGDKVKDKDGSASEGPRKDPAKDPRAVKGAVDAVDLKTNLFVLQLPGKETRTFSVTKKTEFWGPRGARGEGLKDDRMAKGYEVVVIPSDDGKSALEVHLPYRKPPEEKKKDKGKDKKKAA